jgi:hypothetical protein
MQKTDPLSGAVVCVGWYHDRRRYVSPGQVAQQVSKAYGATAFPEDLDMAFAAGLLAPAAGRPAPASSVRVGGARIDHAAAYAPPPPALKMARQDETEDLSWVLANTDDDDMGLQDHAPPTRTLDADRGSASVRSTAHVVPTALPALAAAFALDADAEADVAFLRDFDRRHAAADGNVPRGRASFL